MLCLLLANGFPVVHFTLHQVLSKVSAANFASAIQDNALTLASVVDPVTIIDLLCLMIVHFTSANTFAVQKFSDVNIARHLVIHASLNVFAFLVPTSLIS